MGIVEFSKFKANMFSGLTHAPSGWQCFRCHRGLSSKCLELDFSKMKRTGSVDVCFMQYIVECNQFIGVAK